MGFFVCIKITQAAKCIHECKTLINSPHIAHNFQGVNLKVN